jgi:hypothetical protein
MWESALCQREREREREPLRSSLLYNKIRNASFFIEAQTEKHKEMISNNPVLLSFLLKKKASLSLPDLQGSSALEEEESQLHNISFLPLQRGYSCVLNPFELVATSLS